MTIKNPDYEYLSGIVVDHLKNLEAANESRNTLDEAVRRLSHDPLNEANEHLSDIQDQHDIVIQQLMEANNNLHKHVGVLEGQLKELKELNGNNRNQLAELKDLNSKNESQLFVLNAQMKQMMADSHDQKRDIKISRIISLFSLAVAVLSILLQYWPS